MIRTNIRIYSYIKIIRTNIRIYLYQKKMRIWYERIFLSENIRIYIWIFEYSSHPGTNTIHARNKKCNNHTTELSHVPKQIALLGLLYLFVDCSADFCNLTNLMDSLSHWVESESAILTLGLAGSKYISSTESAMARTLRPWIGDWLLGESTYISDVCMQITWHFLYADWLLQIN